MAATQILTTDLRLGKVFRRSGRAGSAGDRRSSRQATDLPISSVLQLDDTNRLLTVRRHTRYRVNVHPRRS